MRVACGVSPLLLIVIDTRWIYVWQGFCDWVPQEEEEEKKGSTEGIAGKGEEEENRSAQEGNSHIQIFSPFSASCMIYWFWSPCVNDNICSCISER